MWSWFTGPFGAEAPNTNRRVLAPSPTTCASRDRSRGWGSTFQNFHRDYDPAVGRYVESDPIGLRGGINTYVYSADDPVLFYDPSGRCASTRS